MDNIHAQSLHKQAVEALSQLRAWIWAQHSTLLPDDVATVTRAQAALYSAYLEWYSTVETALQAVEAAAPSFDEPQTTAQLAEETELAEEETPVPRTLRVTPVPPTLRVTPAPRPTSRSGVWQRTIAVSALASEESAARDSSSRHALARPSAVRHAHARPSARRPSAA